MRHRTEIDADRAVECSSCGKTGGNESSVGVHCGDCGRFSAPIKQYCLRHNVDYGRLTGYDHCPKCRETERVEQMRQEMHQRRANERMHSMVDAPRF